MESALGFWAHGDDVCGHEDAQAGGFDDVDELFYF